MRENRQEFINASKLQSQVIGKKILIKDTFGNVQYINDYGSTKAQIINVFERDPKKNQL